MSDGTPKDLREAFESLQKEHEKLQKKNESLASENRTLKASNAFRDAELSPDLADLYVAANPDASDISVDEALSFAQKYGIQGGAVPAASDDGQDDGAEQEPQVTKQEPDRSGLENIARAGSGAGGTGQPPASDKTLTRDEFLTLQRDNPAAARQALAEGRVKLRADNPLAEGSNAPLGSNPFQRQHQAVSEE